MDQSISFQTSTLVFCLFYSRLVNDPSSLPVIQYVKLSGHRNNLLLPEGTLIIEIRNIKL